MVYRHKGGVFLQGRVLVYIRPTIFPIKKLAIHILWLESSSGENAFDPSTLPFATVPFSNDGSDRSIGHPCVERANPPPTH